MTRVFGILGWPVAHSRSPAMHRAAFAALRIDALYAPFAVRPERLSDAITGLRALGIDGANVTLPHKETVVPLLDEVEPSARAIGAVNTILRDDDRLIGANTDAPGLARALTEAGFDPDRRRAVVLGAGGAARAAVVGLAAAGAAEIVVAARRPERAAALLDDVRGACGATRLDHTAFDDLRGPFARADLLVQATSATLEGRPDAEAFAGTLPLDALPEHAVVNDLVYQPRETTVLRRARERDLRTVDGLGMLLHQGAIAFERWTGRDAPLDAMRRALEPP